MASAQARGGVRLVRTWVAGILAVAVAIGVCVFYAYAHGALGMGMVAGGFAPRLMIGELGLVMLWVPFAGILLLAFDNREMDARDGIAEAMDAKPASNLTVIAGRLAGTVAVVAIPLFVAVAVLQLAGWTARRTDYWMGDPFESYSLVGFVVVDVIPVLVLWGATIVLLSAVLKSRVAVVVAAASLLTVQVWLMREVSVHLLPVLPMVSHATRSASDLVPWIADFDTLLQRGAMLLMAAGFCAITAAAHHRRDSYPRSRQLVAGLSLVVVSVAVIGTIVMRELHNVQQRDAWFAVHRDARQGVGAVPDVEELSGSVRIFPGKILEVDVEASFVARDATSSLLFTLNPGLRVTSLRLDGRPVEFTHVAGLLVVDPVEPVPRGAHRRLGLTAAGVPDPEFGYLESSVDWRRRSARNLIRHLGTRASVFHRNYVALTPSVHWLPMAGTVLDVQPDFYRLDLRVEAPSDWSVAGPGRQPRSVDGVTRFSPRLPVRETALYASDFVRRDIKLQGMEVELLVSPEHMPNLEYFAPAVDAAVDHMETLLDSLKRGGLPYEDRVVTLVEVPATLRTYRGGWLLDPMRSPGVLPLREERIPMARFGHAERLMAPLGADPDGVRDWRFQQLVLTLANSGSGGEDILRLFTGMLLDATAPAGEGSTALDYVCRELAFRSLFPWAPIPYGFSGHAFDTEVPLVSSIGELWTAVSAGHYGHLSYALQEDSSNSLLWADTSGFPLSKIDALPARRAANALLLKGGALAQAITDSLGGERTLELLGRLRRLDPPFSTESFMAIVKDAHADIGEAVEQAWLNPGLPGFIASRVEVVSLPQDANGDGDSYFVSVHVRNDEPVHGALRLGYNEYNAATDPVWVPGDSSVEIGLVTTTPPEQLWLLPYLSLNRENVRLVLPRTIQDAAPGHQRFTGTRPSMWRPRTTEIIVVDDLDSGFSTESDDRGWSLPAYFRHSPKPTEEGLPDAEREVGEWIRRSVPGSWGKYRRTVAQSRPGDGDRRAVFEAHLAAGQWQLDYHLPPRLVPSASPGGASRALFPALGSMAIELAVFEPLPDSERDAPQTMRVPVEFDAGAGLAGWNNLGEFEVLGGMVRVEVTNRTTGQAVIADAIRWRRVN